MHLFISDLHLDAERPQITRLFLQFLNQQAVQCDGLFILGDLFEAWIGDDDDDPHHAQVIQGLGALARSGVPIKIMHGNRDFLIGEQFCSQTGCELLPDPFVLSLQGHQVLLSHGDALCTDDQQYQQIRGMLRSRQWQDEFLSQSLEQRRGFAAKAREESQRYIAGASAELMDVNQQAVIESMTEHACPILIHGHTHRPAVHEFTLNQQPARRIVLGDWYEQGSVLRVSEGQFTLTALPIQAP